MIDINRLCMGCMRKLEKKETICSYCGYDNRIQDERSEKCLALNTILNGRYLIGRVLGEGGFGITYLAMDLVEEIRVAIKEYFPVGLASRDLRRTEDTELNIMSGQAGLHYKEGLNNFIQEGQILAGFEILPGIVDARDFFLENNTAYLVMEYVEGQSLKEHMNQRRQENQIGMDYRTALTLLEPVVESLIAIHNKNLIHRDISPDNIIIGSDGQVKVIDFGAARAQMGNELSSLTVMVKHGYAPEEQYRAHGKQGAWTDIYALCATMYHMISGILPEDGVERLYQDRVVPLDKLELEVPVPEEISDVIAKGMAVRAEARYQSMEELHLALKEAEEVIAGREREKAEREENEKIHKEQKEKEEINRKLALQLQEELNLMRRQKILEVAADAEESEVEKKFVNKKEWLTTGWIIFFIAVFSGVATYGGINLYRDIFEMIKYIEEAEEEWWFGANIVSCILQGIQMVIPIAFMLKCLKYKNHFEFGMGMILGVPELVSALFSMLNVAGLIRYIAFKSIQMICILLLAVCAKRTKNGIIGILLIGYMAFEGMRLWIAASQTAVNDYMPLEFFVIVLICGQLVVTIYSAMMLIKDCDK